MTTRIPVAQALAHVLDLPVRIHAYDGSTAGPEDAVVTVTINSSKALSHMVSAPGELGMARAYVSGEMDLDAPDHFTILSLLARQKIGDLTWAQRLAVLRSIGPEVLQWVEPPAQEVGAKRYLSGLRVPSRQQAQPAGEAAQPLHHPARRPQQGDRAPRFHRALRLPRR